MVRRRLIILTAVDIEARAIASIFGLPAPKPGRPARTADAVPTVEIHLVGIGAKQMPENLSEPPIRGIIMAGLAGALDPKLRVGDVVIDDCPAAFLPEVSFTRGTIHQAAKIVGTSREKQELYETGGALAVDMESAIVRQAAKKWNVPFVSVRAISDSANESLNPTMVRFIDPFGRVRPLALAGSIIRRPGLIPELLRLGQSARMASDNLAGAVAGIVAAWRAMELGDRRNN